jgi:hypothetical protein
MWPVLRDDEAPYRNLAFRFACLAVALARADAAADVATFLKLLKARNNLAHAGGDVDATLAQQSIALLRKYTAIVASAEMDGRVG